jgi:hypothetical protein
VLAPWSLGQIVGSIDMIQAPFHASVESMMARW